MYVNFKIFVRYKRNEFQLSLGMSLALLLKRVTLHGDEKGYFPAEVTDNADANPYSKFSFISIAFAFVPLLLKFEKIYL